MRILCSLAVILIFSSSAFALTLDDAVSLALENSDAIKQSRAKAESSEYTKSSAIAPFLPNANLSYGYNETKIEGVPAGNVLMQDGTTKQATATASVSYNLFNGLGDWNKYKLSIVGVKMSQYQYKASKQDVILNTKNAYIAYLKAKDELGVANITLKLLEAQKNIAEASYQVGSFTKSDVLRVDVQLASTRLQVLNAQINMRLAQQQLEYNIGREIPEGEEVAGITLQPSYSVPDLQTLYQMLEDNRSELLYTKSAYQSATLQKKSGSSGFLPKANISYAYSWDGDDLNAFNGRDNNYDKSQVLGLTLTWNIFTGLYDMNTYKANAKSELAASYAVSDLRKTLRLQVSNAYQTYFSAREMLTVAEVGMAQARESYRVMENLYENSEATTTDLLDANVALNNAMISHSAAVYNIISTIAKIERSVETEILGLSVSGM